MTAFAELVAATSFSFLRGASAAEDMVAQAISLGYRGLGIADRNTVAGVVRAHVALRDARARVADHLGHSIDFKLAVGARLVFADGTPDIVAYPTSRAGWGHLCRLLTLGNRRAAKGDCTLGLDDLISHSADMQLIAFGAACDEWVLRRLAKASRGKLWLAATMPRQGNDRRRLIARKKFAARLGLPLLATNDALYATPEQRPLHDILTCIREKTTIGVAGHSLAANAERHLKSPAEMTRLFRDAPHALEATGPFLDGIDFSLDQLRYEYPHEPVPEGWQPQPWLENLVLEAARKRHPDGIPYKLQTLLDEELQLIGRLNYACYFLTVYDIVRFARSQGILCQGRGSAANSAVCFMLGITSVDPEKHDLLFSRFLSEERLEPPDIDVDFEHERREEVMQYVYARYGRERAGITGTVIHYRPRSAVREVGKALGLSDDITARLTGTVWGSFANTMDVNRYAEAGFTPDNPEIVRLRQLVDQLLSFPRHLSQHVGGFVLTEGRLDEMVPIHNAAMPDRTFIEWDKDDIDALGLMKVDVLALGMLTCIRKSFDLMRKEGLGDYALDTIPHEDPATYAMLQKGDSVGVFQVESRAQMNMLPRLAPRELYDLVIQVAIVRPGPIEGDMVHPYLRRRQGREAVHYPSPSAEHGPADELRSVLGKTLGVPLFQEQAMKLAIVAARFSPDDANRLRRAMATFRNVGRMEHFQLKMVEGMVARGYDRDFAQRCYKQIEGFGSYGFPESHALAFARLVYVSSWIKCHYPQVFACALLNSQPMGFYAPAQIVADARGHSVDVLPIDVNASKWDNALENTLNLRLGLRQITGFRKEWAQRIEEERPFLSIEDLARRAALPRRALNLLADADACGSLNLARREASWEVRRNVQGVLPLFAAAQAPELGIENDLPLDPMPPAHEVVTDYQTTQLSLRSHPMAFLRDKFAKENVLSTEDVRTARNGRRIKVAGVVLIRQRPGKGNAIFVTIEDEKGVANLLIWARLFENNRRAVMASRLMLVEGDVQRSPEGVVHVMVSRVVNRTADLDHLSDDDATHEPFSLPPAIPRHGHPRDVRILPRSRDFH